MLLFKTVNKILSYFNNDDRDIAITCYAIVISVCVSYNI